MKSEKRQHSTSVFRWSMTVMFSSGILAAFAFALISKPEWRYSLTFAFLSIFVGAVIYLRKHELTHCVAGRPKSPDSDGSISATNAGFDSSNPCHDYGGDGGDGIGADGH